MSRESFSPYLNAQKLPQELLKELRVENSDESKIVEIFREGGGILNISEVLVGFFKMHNEIKTRAHMTTILYKLSKKGVLRKTGKKGEYELLQSS